MDENIINNIIPLNASQTLNADVKKDVKVNATNERFTSSIDFSAYSFCWYSLISIGKSISYGLCYVKECLSEMMALSPLVLDWAYMYSQDVRSNSIGWKAQELPNILRAGGEWLYGFQYSSSGHGSKLRERSREV